MDGAEELLSASALRQARQQRQWSQPQAAVRFVRIAQRLNIAVGGQESVKTALSRWENGKRLPDEANRRVLREMFGSATQSSVWSTTRGRPHRARRTWSCPPGCGAPTGSMISSSGCWISTPTSYGCWIAVWALRCCSTRWARTSRRSVAC